MSVFSPSRSISKFALFGAALAGSILIAPAAWAQAVPVPNANQYGPQMIGAPAAWARGYNGAGIVVVVADSGIDPNHPAFAGKIDPRSRNFVLTAPGAVYNPNDVSDLTADSHGTHVAGIVAASAASGVPGIAYGANLLVLKALDGCASNQDCSVPSLANSGTTEALLYYAGLDNAFIYNASYGPNAPKDTKAWPSTIFSKSEADAALGALVKGKIIVAANGNDGDKSPIASANPNGLALYPFLNPANANAGVYLDGGNAYNFSNLLGQSGLIIAVASVGQAKTIASYSQRCGVTASWCVTAPGGDQANDAGIYATLPNNTYGYMQGTSMAAPTVSGALAVLAQAYPGYAARDLANVMFATAENIGGMAGDNAIYGYGLIRLDRATDGPTTLAAGQGVDVAAQRMTYWSQPLTTAGGFTKTGTGYLMVAGRTTATGDVAVNAGALGVDGTLTLQTQLTVAQGATLAGFGRIVGNTTIAGTLSAGQLPNYADLAANNGGTVPAGIPASGTSPGTLTFQGNVTLTATATLRENIDGALVIPGGPGTFDKTIVTGTGATFTAGGTLAPVLRGIVGGNNTYSPAVGAAFAIVSAQNGAAVAGQFANLAQPAAGLAPNTRLDVVYAATGVTLNVTPLNFQALAANQNLDPNAQAVAAALDTERPTAGTKLTARSHMIYDDLYDDTVGGDDSELSSLDGEGHAAVAGATLATFADFGDAIGTHEAMTTLAFANLDSSADAGEASPQAASFDPAAGWTLWEQGFGRWSRTDASLGLPGSHNADTGFSAGFDRAFATDLLAGGAFGYARTLSNSAGEHATTDTYAGAAYASWTPANFVVDARLAAGPASTRTTRQVAIMGVPTTVTGGSDGWSGLFAVDLGYRLDADGFALRPYAGLTLQTLHQDGFTETSPAGLTFPSQDFDKVTSALGLRAATQVDAGGMTFRPELRLAWTHDFDASYLTTDSSLLGGGFRISTADPGRDAAVLGFDLAATLADKFDVFLGYTGEFRRNAASHEAHGGIRLAL